jgi:hypothetical protein
VFLADQPPMPIACSDLSHERGAPAVGSRYQQLLFGATCGKNTIASIRPGTTSYYVLPGNAEQIPRSRTCGMSMGKRPCRNWARSRCAEAVCPMSTMPPVSGFPPLKSARTSEDHRPRVTRAVLAGVCQVVPVSIRSAESRASLSRSSMAASLACRSLSPESAGELIQG